MAHWHDYNPWAATLTYAASLDEWLSCLAVPASRKPYRDYARGYRVDCYYILNSSGLHSMGMRYGKAGEAYYSPPGNSAKIEATVNRINGRAA